MSGSLNRGAEFLLISISDHFQEFHLSFDFEVLSSLRVWKKKTGLTLKKKKKKKKREKEGMGLPPSLKCLIKEH